MVFRITHKDLSKLIKINWKKKIPLIIYGGFGLGKSQKVNFISKEIAKESGREFIEWDKTDYETKEKLFKNPEKYFVLLDFRTSNLDATDLRGLPNFRADKKTIEWKLPYFIEYMTLKNSMGIAFWDEVNLGVPLVLSSLYKLVYDRCCDGCKITDDWFMIMAGNRAEDLAYTTDIPAPLKDRASEIELVLNSEEWLRWAIDNRIDSRIIGFISFKTSNLYKFNPEDNQKFCTPRSYERLSKLIEGVTNLDDLLLISSSAIGEGVASEFTAFCKIKDKVKIEQIIKNPEKLKEFNKPEDLGIKYFIITALADCYRNDKAKFKDIMNITEVLDEIKNPEFNALLLRLCMAYKPEFEQEFLKGDTLKFSNKYLKYLR